MDYSLTGHALKGLNPDDSGSLASMEKPEQLYPKRDLIVQAFLEIHSSSNIIESTKRSLNSLHEESSI